MRGALEQIIIYPSSL